MEVDAATKGSEFWLLLSKFVKSLTFEKSSAALSALESCVLPLLDRFDFLVNCEDMRALRSIIEDLHLAGLDLPFDTRKALACKLLQRALVSESIANARDYITFAKRIVDNKFYAMVGAIDEASLLIIKNGVPHGDLDHMLNVVEEELCWDIVEEPNLLQHAFRKEGDSTSRLESLLQRGLQSQDSAVRLETLRLAFACSFHSKTIYSTLQPIFETALYLEHFEIREYVLAALMDVIYLHHRTLQFDEVRHFVTPFFYAPTVKMQYAAVIGCGRFLLGNCFPEETEYLLGAMFERYVYSPPKSCTLQGNMEPVLQAMYLFFQAYSGGHQDEISNALVFMCLQKIEEGAILIAGRNSIRYSNKQEAQNVHLALKFGLSIGGNILDAVMDGLAINICSQFGADISNEDCLSWFESAEKNRWKQKACHIGR